MNSLRPEPAEDKEAIKDTVRIDRVTVESYGSEIAGENTAASLCFFTDNGEAFTLDVMTTAAYTANLTAAIHAKDDETQAYLENDVFKLNDKQIDEEVIRRKFVGRELAADITDIATPKDPQEAETLFELFGSV